MTHVTREQFYAAFGPRDVMPNAGPMRSVWRDQRSQRIVGYSYPGHRSVDENEKYDVRVQYYLTEEKSDDK